MIYALDSNIISYLLKDDKQVQERFRAEIDDGNIYTIPQLVYYEIKRGLFFINAQVKLKAFNELYYEGIMNEMIITTWDKAVEIYIKLTNKGKLIDDADIFIAALCVVNNYILVTNNIRHFEDISDLNFVNWKE